MLQGFFFFRNWMGWWQSACLCVWISRKEEVLCHAALQSGYRQRWGYFFPHYHNIEKRDIPQLGVPYLTKTTDCHTKQLIPDSLSSGKWKRVSVCLCVCTKGIAQGQQCLCLCNAPVMWPSWNGCTLSASLSLSSPSLSHLSIPETSLSLVLSLPFSYTLSSRWTPFPEERGGGSISDKQNFWFWDESLWVDHHDNH